VEGVLVEDLGRGENGKGHFGGLGFALGKRDLLTATIAHRSFHVPVPTYPMV